MTFFFSEITLQVTQKTPDLRHDDFFLSLEITYFFLDRRCKKTALQSLSYDIFAKTSDHTRIFFGANAKG